VTTTETSLRPTARVWLAAGISAAVLVLAVAGGMRSSPAALGPLIFVVSLSARISGVFLSLGAKAPFGYAFVAGMVASVNPCGFVLLPAYLAYYLGGDPEGGPGSRRPMIRALAVSATVAASFALLFGLAGLLAGLAADSLTSVLPWLGTAVGVGLILLAGVLASGRELTTSFGPRMAQHLRTATRNRGLRGYAAYGLASLGCTLPVFLGVVGTSFQVHGLAAAIGQFVLFGLGMGAVLAVLTIATAGFGDGIIRRARTLGPYIGWASATILWLAGAYIVYYWLTAIRLV